MQTTTTIKREMAPALGEMEKELAGIEEKVVLGYTLADAMREGSKVTTQAYGWGGGMAACALTSAATAATARGYGGK